MRWTPRPVSAGGAVPDVSAQFPPQVLREYSFIADGERGALIGPRGDFAWMCAPRWHDDAVFSTLIGGGGIYAVTPDVDRAVWGGYYESGSLIWRSPWAPGDVGVVESRDALAPPADEHCALVLRCVTALDRPAPVRAVLDVSAGFGQKPLRDVHRRGDVWTARSGRLYVRWSGVDDVRRTSLGYTVTRTVSPGEYWYLALEISDRAFDGNPPDQEAAWDATENAWRVVLPDMSGTVAPTDACNAFTVLHGLTAASGGMVAAATMSLPERAEQGRNYDYRYVWIRDQCYAGQAAAVTGADRILDSAVRFVSERLLADGSGLKPAYTVTGDPVPEERSLRGLDGYPGGSDRVGNRVNSQFQLDVFGEALQLFAAAARLDRLDNEPWRAVEAAAAAIEKRWREPDNGIWEIDRQRWTHSRLMCVAGLRAISREAPAKQAGRWTSLADKVLAGTTRDSLHESGRCSDRLMTTRSTQRFSSPGSAGPSVRTTRGRQRPSTPCARSCAATTTSIDSASSPGRWRTPKAPSCSAGSSSHWPSTQRATRSRRCATSSATAPHADRRASTARSTTSGSGSFAATSHRPSCTP